MSIDSLIAYRKPALPHPGDAEHMTATVIIQHPLTGHSLPYHYGDFRRDGESCEDFRSRLKAGLIGFIASG